MSTSHTKTYYRQNTCIAFFLRKILAFVFLYCAFTVTSNAQTTPSSYNRFQYHNHKWLVLHTSAFHIYFPKGYDSLCAFAARELPGITALLKQRMFTESNKVLNIIIYPSADQLYETNIGSGEIRNATFPTITLKGNRLIVAYGGSYEQLKQQLSEALARNNWEQQFDNGIGEQLRATVVNEKIPEWCKEGMINFFANGWTIEQEDKLKRTFTQNNFPSWYEVIGYQPKLSGTAFCYYLTRHYHPKAVSQLYQLLKKKKDLNRAVRLVTKKNLPQTLQECFLFYRQRFGTDSGEHNGISGTRETRIALKHPRGILKDMEVSSDGRYWGYVIYHNKQRSVYISDRQSKARFRLCTYPLPPWFDDLSRDVYPLIKWKKEKNELLVVYPQKGKLVLKTFSSSGSKLTERILKNTDGITALNDYEDNRQLLSAFRKGQSDIVIYDQRKEKYRAVTNDVYDDHEPVFNEQTGVTLFQSKRKLKKEGTEKPDKDSLYWVQGIFKTDHLQQPVVKDTLSYIQWRKPEIIQDGTWLTTHTRYGMEQFALISPSGSILSLGTYQPYSYSSKTNQLHFYSSSPDSFFISSINADKWISRAQANGENDMSAAWLKDYIADADKRITEDSILKAAKANYEPGFLEGVLKPGNSKELGQKRRDSIYQSVQYAPDKVEPYILQLHSAYFTAKVNNDYFINRYQPYQNYQGQFKFPVVGGMVQGGFTDLFENHHFNIGYRLPTGTEGSDFFVYYQNTKKRTDWGIQYFRKVENLQPDPKRKWLDENGSPYPNTAKVKTHYYEFSLHHPLSYYTTIDFSTAVRKDKTVFLATEKYSLNVAPLKSVWSINTLSYSYNKLIPTLPMLYRGFAGKAIVDLFAGLQGFANDAVYGAGVYFQYHQPLYRYITIAAGLKAGHSGGRQKILYNMGGVDNNLTVRTDTSVHFNQYAPYAFQTLVTPLRGFQQNTLYGNQYALLNLDVYFPLFQSLLPIETSFSSINNLQIGLFSDVAHAKETWLPASGHRSKMSYGFSARTLLAGYNIRADIALPNDANKKVSWYLSVSM